MTKRYLKTPEEVIDALQAGKKIQQIGGKTLDISNQLLDLTKGYLEDKAKDK